MILTTSLNPCIDKTLYVRGLPTNRLVRTKRVELITGGKGMNTARVLKALGAPVKAFALLGGETDRRPHPHADLDPQGRRRRLGRCARGGRHGAEHRAGRHP
jgi:hypothetical protein